MKPESNLNEIWQSYVGAFKESHALSLLQEDGQNSFDAYAAKTDPKQMKILVEYDADTRTYRWFDYGTGGMPHCQDCDWGIRPDGKACKSLACPWGCYHNAGFSTKKKGDKLGNRGMGKALQILSGSKTFIRTTLTSGESMASVWQLKDGDWDWEKTLDAVKPLTPSGTMLETLNVVDEVHAVLQDPEAVVGELQYRWFRLIEQGAHIEFRLTKGGKTAKYPVKEMEWPGLDKSLGAAKAKVGFDKLQIKTVGGKPLGEFRNFKLFLAEKPFDSDDPRAGLAIVKNGKQTVTSFTNWGHDIPEDIRRRLFGYCDAICTEDSPFLRDAENSTHTDYQKKHMVYVAVQRRVQEIAKTLTLPFGTIAAGTLTKEQEAEAEDFQDMLNDVLSDIKVLDIFGPGTVETANPPKSWVFLSRLEVVTQRYPLGSTVPVKAVVRNPTFQPAEVVLHFEHTRLDGTPVGAFVQALVVAPGTPEKPGTVDEGWKLELDPALDPGIYWVKAVLKDNGGNTLTDAAGKPIVLRHRLYVDTDPPKVSKAVATSASKKTKPSATPKGSGGVKVMFFPGKNSAEESFIDDKNATIMVNRNGQRVAQARKFAKEKSEGYWPTIAVIVGEEIAAYKIEEQLSEKNDWTSDEVLKLYETVDAARRKLVRTMAEKMGGKDAPGLDD